MSDNHLPSKNLSALMDANKDYSETFDKSGLASPPAKRFAILTCMDRY